MWALYLGILKSLFGLGNGRAIFLGEHYIFTSKHFLLEFILWRLFVLVHILFVLLQWFFVPEDLFTFRTLEIFDSIMLLGILTVYLGYIANVFHLNMLLQCVVTFKNLSTMRTLRHFISQIFVYWSVFMVICYMPFQMIFRWEGLVTL